MDDNWGYPHDLGKLHFSSNMAGKSPTRGEQIMETFETMGKLLKICENHGPYGEIPELNGGL